MRAHTITTTRLALLLSLLALGVLGLVACSSGGDDETTGTPEAAPSPEQGIEQAGSEWAPLFAGRERFCELMTQPACGRVNCETISGPVANCTPPSSEFRKSFRDATVKDVAITGDTAAARFSNGETVELEKVHNIPDPLAEDGDRIGWLIHKVGGNAGDVEFITKVGNEWAPLFAKDDVSACNRYMYGQPFCEEFFGKVGEPPEVGRPSAFQESFANATVERVELRDVRQVRAKDGTPIELHRAAAEFSNGEVVEFIEETDAPRSDLGKWFVDDLGGNAGKKKPCGKYGRWRLVVEVGDISCPAARRVMDGFVVDKLPRPWICTGPDGHVVCTKEPGIVITARFWRCLGQRTAPITLDRLRRFPIILELAITRSPLAWQRDTPSAALR
jgi:hypothetical protein